MSQVPLWQQQQGSAEYAELCNALYERELQQLAQADIQSVTAIQARLKSLPYYINRTVLRMNQADSPLDLDIQNASWSAKQAKVMPLNGQEPDDVWLWYQNIELTPGLITPILSGERILIDSIDRIEPSKERFRTNAHGWFTGSSINDKNQQIRLLKPNKKVMTAACAGHRWQDNGIAAPAMLSLRELLLSCSINWRNFKMPVVF